MSNSFGKIFRITTFGESHGTGLGVIIDGCPAGISVDEEFIQSEMARRKPGQSAITTQRKEPDQVVVLSGIFEGKTTGTPIGISIANTNARSEDYAHIQSAFRPSHADYTYQEKYGIRDHRGGGRSSARETANWVAAGAIAKILLKTHGVEIDAFVSAVGSVELDTLYSDLDLSRTEENAVRCPDPEVAAKMESLIREVRKSGDTVGGVVTGVARNVPVGLGEPVFDKLHARLGQAMLTINAVKGFEYGSGFDGTQMRGSEHNDLFENTNGISTKSNRSGGIQGGISNGEDIYFRVAFKPVATIMKDQQSVDKDGKEATVSGKGRHDPCVVPRAVPIVEAMTAIVLADFLLLHRTSNVSTS